ncbi:hypothetical protein [Shewanella violacea]|uniref:Uncharacterized protein n=1 Tax=Shewanella violacea (strain JCM 10179 / CIP 106290 / LMG 19151 / DSS12) TaxID=637905 RepID=D4ZMB5_SHEVD|nr:hypothetical protein [Shewanella violacea]BAJ02814.1 hypothetical protein SVI_2843 [Shewanella violacea DSS12]
MKNHILVCLLPFCTYANAFTNDMSNEFTDDYIKLSQGGASAYRDTFTMLLQPIL